MGEPTDEQDLLDQATQGVLVADYERWLDLYERASAVLAAALTRLAAAQPPGVYELWVTVDDVELSETSRVQLDSPYRCGSVGEAVRRMTELFGETDLCECITVTAVHPCDPDVNDDLVTLPCARGGWNVVFALASDAPNPSVSIVLLAAPAGANIE